MCKCFIEELQNPVKKHVDQERTEKHLRKYASSLILASVCSPESSEAWDHTPAPLEARAWAARCPWMKSILSHTFLDSALQGPFPRKEFGCEPLVATMELPHSVSGVTGAQDLWRVTNRGILHKRLTSALPHLRTSFTDSVRWDCFSSSCNAGRVSCLGVLSALN